MKIELICKDCGDKLKAEFDKHSVLSTIYYIEPCQSCITKSSNEGYFAGEKAAEQRS